MMIEITTKYSYHSNDILEHLEVGEKFKVNAECTKGYYAFVPKEHREIFVGKGFCKEIKGELESMTIEFKTGEKIKRKDGEMFSNEQFVNTVSIVKDGYKVYMKETGTYLDADRLEKVENDMTIEFKPGDKVKKKSGEPFSNGGSLEATVDYVKGGYMVYFLETGTWIGADRLEKVENDMENPFKVGQKVVSKVYVNVMGSYLDKGEVREVTGVQGNLVSIEGYPNLVHAKYFDAYEEDVKDITQLHDAMLESLKPSFSEMNALKQERPDSEHYTDSGIDVWQFADANFDYDELFGFHRINAIKYLTRFGKKEGRNIRDLEKAEAIIKEMIRMEKEGE